MSQESIKQKEVEKFKIEIDNILESLDSSITEGKF